MPLGILWFFLVISSLAGFFNALLILSDPIMILVLKGWWKERRKIQRKRKTSRPTPESTISTSTAPPVFENGKYSKSTNATPGGGGKNVGSSKRDQLSNVTEWHNREEDLARTIALNPTESVQSVRVECEDAPAEGSPTAKQCITTFAEEDENIHFVSQGVYTDDESYIAPRRRTQLQDLENWFGGM